MASGSTLCTFEPAACLQPTSNMGTFDRRNQHLVIDFDDTTVETVYFEAILPRNYAGGGITATIVWLATSATTGDVIWSISWERHDTGTDLDSDSFASEQTATATTSATSGKPTYTTIAFTNGAQIDSVSVGEHFRLQVRRNASTGGDTMTGDAELVSIELKET